MPPAGSNTIGQNVLKRALFPFMLHSSAIYRNQIKWKSIFRHRFSYSKCKSLNHGYLPRNGQVKFRLSI